MQNTQLTEKFQESIKVKGEKNPSHNQGVTTPCKVRDNTTQHDAKTPTAPMKPNIKATLSKKVWNGGVGVGVGSMSYYGRDIDKKTRIHSYALKSE